MEACTPTTQACPGVDRDSILTAKASVLMLAGGPVRAELDPALVEMLLKFGRLRCGGCAVPAWAGAR